MDMLISRDLSTIDLIQPAYLSGLGFNQQREVPLFNRHLLA